MQSRVPVVGVVAVAFAFAFAWDCLYYLTDFTCFNHYFYLLAHSQSSTFTSSSTFTLSFYTMVAFSIVVILGVYKANNDKLG